MFKKAIFISLLVLSVAIAYSQRIMKKVSLTADDKAKEIILKYDFSPEGIYHVKTTLALYRSGRYEYYESNIPQSHYSVGKWRINNKSLILNSDLQQCEVPIKIKYVMRSNVDKKTKIGDVYDTIRNTWVYAYILVNNDSTICNPTLLDCKGSYAKIDSVKILFVGRMTSKWIKVEDKPLYRLEFIIDSDVNVEAYIPMHNKRFVFKGDTISINWYPLPSVGRLYW